MKPRIHYDALDVGQEFTLQYRVDDALIRAHLDALCQEIPDFLKNPSTSGLIADPGIFVRNGIRLLRTQYLVHGVIHARAEVELVAPLQSNQTVTVSGKVVDKYIRRERPYVTIESVTTDESGQVIGRERNTFVLTLKKG